MMVGLRSLHGKLLILALSSALVSGLVIGYSSYKGKERILERHFEATLSTLAREGARDVETWLAERRAATEATAENSLLRACCYGLREFETESDDYFLALQRLTEFVGLTEGSAPYFSEVWASDAATGEVLASSPGAPATKAMHDQRELAVLRTGKTLVTSIVPSRATVPDETDARSTGVPTFLIAAPITDEGGDVVGILTARTNVLALTQLVRVDRTELSGHDIASLDVYVVDRRGVLLTQSAFEADRREDGPLEAEAQVELDVRVRGTGEFTEVFKDFRGFKPREGDSEASLVTPYPDYRGIPVVGAWAPISGTDWCVIAEIDYDDMMVPLLREFRTSVALTLGVAAVVAVLAALLSRALVAPLVRVTNVAGRLAAGDRTVRCAVERNDEVGQLAATFDGMADAIETSIAGLEGAVSTRTAHLNKEIEDRKRIEEELRRSEERYALAQQAGNIGSWDWDITTGELNWSEQIEPMFGFRRGQFAGTYEGFLQSIHPEDRSDVVAAVDAAVEAGADYAIDHRVVWPDGTIRWIREAGTARKDERGTATRMLGICQDVTERKLGEEAMRESRDSLEIRVRQRTSELQAANDALRESDDRVRHLLDSTAEAIYGLDLDGNCTFCNAACLRMLGYDTQDQLLGKNMHELMHHTRPDGSPYPAEECRAHTAFQLGGETHVDDEWLWRADGLGFPAEYWSYPLSRAGRVIGSVVTFLDITERREAERRQVFVLDILGKLNSSGGKSELLHELLSDIQRFTGFEAVAFRLKEGDDYPYFSVSGFSAEFVEVETHLCSRDAGGTCARDSDGYPILECMCGNILRGRTNPSLPFFSEGGSFHTDCTTRLLATTTEKERQARTRNRCNAEGYESVVLVPLRSGNEIIGLLQLNDHRIGMASPGLVTFLEGIGASIGIALGRRQLEESLRESEKKYADLYNNAPDMYVAVDAETANVLRCNQTLADKLGYAKPDIIGHPICKLYHPDSIDKAHEAFETFVRTGTVRDAELQLMRSDGKKIDVALNVSAVRDETGTIRESRSCWIDISERKQREEVLRASLALHHEIGASSEEKIMSVALEECIRLTASDIGFFHLIDDDQKTVRSHIWSKSTLNRCAVGGGDAHCFDESASLWAACLRRREPVVVNDYRSMSEARGLPKGHVPFDRGVAVPVFEHGRIAAVLGVGNKADVYRDFDVDQVSLFAGNAWSIIQRKRAEDALRQSEQELAIRNEIANVFLTVTDDGMYDATLAVVLRAVESEIGVFGHIDENGAFDASSMTPGVLGSCQVPGKAQTFPRETWGDSSWPRALREKKPNWSNVPSVKVPEGHLAIQRHVSVPIVHQGEAIGLFQAANKPTDYSDNDIRLLETIGDAIAPVLSARLQRQREEKARRQAEEGSRQLGAIVEDSDDAIIGKSLDGTIRTWNRGAAAVYGYSPEEAIGKSISMLVPPDLPDEIPGILRKIGRGEIVDHFETQRRRKDGRRIAVSVTVSPVMDAEGRIVAASAISRDISARKEAEAERERLIAELESKNRELNDFTYVASHDLQEPLRKVTAFSELLESDVGGNLPARAAKDVEYITDAARRMQRLVQDLLQLSRTGRSPVSRERVAISECVDEALANLAARIEETGAQIVRDPLPEVTGDHTLITQLYQNLLGNALKFIAPDRHPEIQVTAQRKDRNWVLGVRDNGIGIQPEHVDQIFTPFKRLHGRGAYDGSGIGLSICRKVVERHRGSIWTEPGPGEGTHFKFTIEDPSESEECTHEARHSESSC